MCQDVRRARGQGGPGHAFFERLSTDLTADLGIGFELGRKDDRIRWCRFDREPVARLLG